MSRPRITVLALVTMLALGTAARQSNEKEFELSDGKAGAVEIGMTVDDLYAKIGQGNTKLVDLFREGFFSPAIQIYLAQNGGNKPSLVAQILGKLPDRDPRRPLSTATFIVGAITVYDPKFKTDKGIGVGSTLGEIRRNYKVDWIDFGEGPLIARVEQEEMSFALEPLKVPPEFNRTRNAALIPDSARVAYIFLTKRPGR